MTATEPESPKNADAALICPNWSERMTASDKVERRYVAVFAEHQELERQRIAFVEQRDGCEGAREWALRVIGYYRRAVLDRARKYGESEQHGEIRMVEINYKGGFASRDPWKTMCIASYVELKRYLGSAACQP